MHETASAWLAKRKGGVPASIAGIVDAAIGAAPQARPVPETLEAAANALLARSLAAPGDPYVLLAADALITFACEAASELQPSTLADHR